jgi:hypothetical protein
VKGKVIVSKFWTRFFSWGKADAVTIFPFIFMRKERFRHNTNLLNHERIHLRQALELLIIPFYVWYLIEFCCRLPRYRNFYLAYRNISFEREAYENDSNLGYLTNRRFWNFLAFL